MKNKSQMFRFCLNCIRVSLIQEGKCYFCNGNFIVSCHSDYLHKIKKSEKAH